MHMPSVETAMRWADLAVAFCLMLIWVASYLSARSERNKMRALRRSGYCAHPTTRGGYCRNPQVAPGGRCRANHPSSLPVPVVGLASFVVTFALAITLAFWQPLARHAPLLIG